jgi:hypothetical protein
MRKTTDRVKQELVAKKDSGGNMMHSKIGTRLPLAVREFCEGNGMKLDRGVHADEEGLIPKHGGYRNLKSFQIAQLVFDVTVRFCDRYIDKRSRTHEQMVQAARSGVQNIAEGSRHPAPRKRPR